VEDKDFARAFLLLYNDMVDYVALRDNKEMFNQCRYRISQFNQLAGAAQRETSIVKHRAAQKPRKFHEVWHGGKGRD
jgi:hypothetical protein